MFPKLDGDAPNGIVKYGALKKHTARLTGLIRVITTVSVVADLLLGLGNTVRPPIKARGAGPLFQVHYASKWGYMNRDGKVVIPPQFDDEGDFFGGLAKARIGKTWGFIDESGRVIIPFRFASAGNFQEGLAPVQVERKWGFTNREGRLVIEPQFQAASEFHEGLARFEKWDALRCSGGSGKENAPHEYNNTNANEYVFRLHDMGSVADCFPMDVQYGFVDRFGNVKIPPKFKWADDFSQGRATVLDALSGETLFGYIDFTGKIAIAPRFRRALRFSEGAAAVDVNRGVSGQSGWAFIDKAGRYIVQPRFKEALPFSEGLAQVKVSGQGWGFINRRGELVIPAKYLETQGFSDGLALVSSEDQEDGYFIDKSGRPQLFVASPQFSFSDGLTIGGELGQRYYQDLRGRIVAPYERRQ